jgi:anti-sigma factor RsiW
MRPRARRRFDTHLLACERCWHEVRLARQGRQLAETARDLAPPELREHIRAAVTAAAALPAPSARSPRWHAAAVTAVAVLASYAAIVQPWPHRTPRDAAAPPAVITAAVGSYRANRLPGTAVPSRPAPDLTALNLDLVGAARGSLDGMPITMFAYSTRTGARLVIIRGSRPFPEAGQARELRGTEGAWTARSSGVTIICAQDTHAILLLGTDATLVRRAGALLKAI